MKLKADSLEEKKQPNKKKCSEDLNFLQRRHTDGQEAYEKMFNITNHQSNANQNHSEISPYTFGMAIIKKITNSKSR